MFSRILNLRTYLSTNLRAFLLNFQKKLVRLLRDGNFQMQSKQTNILLQLIILQKNPP